MNEVLHANVFFIIASVATVIFFIIGCFILWQVFKVIRLLRALLERAESASDLIAADVAEARKFVAAGKGFVPTVLGLVFSYIPKKNK